MIKLSNNQKLAASRILASKRAPFLQRGLLALIPVEKPGLGTFGVTDDMRMMWDPVVVEKWTPEQISWVLLHEVSHVLRDHSERADRMKIPADDRYTWNIAGDLEINDDLVTMGADLPDSPELPTKHGWKDGLTAEAYYGLLKQEQKGKKPQPGGHVCSGRCGSGAGQPSPGDPGGGKKKTGQGGAGKQPGSGQGQGGRSKADIQRVKLQVAEAIQQQKGRGNIPGGWAQWADDFIKPSKIRWQDKLARIVKGQVSSRAGMIDYSYARPSRRQAGLTAAWGKYAPIMPSMVSPTPRVAVGADTSGSMGVEGLSRAASELDAILKTVKADVDFIACDCQVHVQRKVKSAADFKDLFKGNGGTDFRPLFDAAEKLRPRPHVFIFITDGDGPSPVNPPKGMKVIWVLVGKHRTDPGVTWGEKIEVDD
jgi:predicted metal-dependent peptidase